MGDTGANMGHWAGIYGVGGNGAAAAEGSVVTVSSPTSGGSGGGSPTRSAPGVEGGRVGKPARRRSRASRRAPVTLLNTDTTNFRAMVQQFTGIPSGPYGPAGAGGGPVISFGAGGGDYGLGGGMPVRPSPSSAVMSFDHLGHHRPSAATSSLQQQQQHQQSQLFRPQQQQQYADYGGGGADMSFLHGFESSAEDRLLLQSIQAAQMLPRPASTNTPNGYNFG
ncbi:neurogenic locus Notch protein-like [Triticum dicoccoides]|uniref:neurogenic locus Notch protein-like n=1 Tax=Triticum dicoccoides TaxID=85692 RepID=UPI000E7B9E93|nr:neurogenic locus Notch protein-like [Triticum dicoccoides]